MKKFFGILVTVILLSAPILAGTQQDKAEFPSWLERGLRKTLFDRTKGISEETAIKLLSEKIDYLESCRENESLAQLLKFDDVTIARLPLYRGYAMLKLTRSGVSACLGDGSGKIKSSIDSVKLYLQEGRPQILMCHRWFRELVFSKILLLTKEDIWTAIAKNYWISPPEK